MVIFSEVKQGSYPVLRCNVIATVERPDGDPVQLELFDNGAGKFTESVKFCSATKNLIKWRLLGDTKKLGQTKYNVIVFDITTRSHLV